jgi:hypothetical protein
MNTGKAERVSAFFCCEKPVSSAAGLLVLPPRDFTSALRGVRMVMQMGNGLLSFC